MLYYALNKIKLASDAQYRIVILASLTYLLSGLASTITGVSLENAGIKPISDSRPSRLVACSGSNMLQ